MNKLKRIRLLEQLDLNCPGYIVVACEDDISKLAGSDVWSIRSFLLPVLPSNIKLKQPSLEKFKQFPIEKAYYPPHAPVIKTKQAKRFLKLLINYHLVGLACPVIDPKDAVFAGAACRENDIITIEVAKGPVMVRKVTRDGEIDYRYVLNANIEGYLYLLTEDPGMNEGLNTIYRDLSEKLPNGYLVELSYYKKPIGAKKQKQIYWDIYKVNHYPNLK